MNDVQPITKSLYKSFKHSHRVRFKLKKLLLVEKKHFRRCSMERELLIWAMRTLWLRNWQQIKKFYLFLSAIFALPCSLSLRKIISVFTLMTRLLIFFARNIKNFVITLSKITSCVMIARSNEILYQKDCTLLRNPIASLPK